MLILKLTISVSLISNELTLITASVHKPNLASSNSPVTYPLSIVEFTVRIITNSSSMSLMIRVVSFVVASILKHHFNFAIINFSFLKPAFQNFILARVQDSHAAGFIIPELSTEKCTTFEHTHSSSMSDIILKSTLVDIAIFHFD
mgnify:CR=1 FL=1